MADAPEDDAVIETLLADAPCEATGITVVVTQTRGRPELAVGASTHPCGRIAIVERDGRWLIDPWAAVVSRSQPNARRR